VQFTYFNLGQLSYSEALEIQKTYQTQVIEGAKLSAILFTEHPKILTLGADFHDSNLLLPRKNYQDLGIEIQTTDRGGDVTYHGPGQLVTYPIFDLNALGKDVHKYLRNLEDSFIKGISEFGVTANMSSVHTGIWAGGKIIASIGIKIRKWVTMHGVALNCNNDLSPFETILPCGLHGYQMTSLSEAAGKQILISDAIAAVVKGFESTFKIVLTEEPWQQH